MRVASDPTAERRELQSGNGGRNDVLISFSKLSRLSLVMLLGLSGTLFSTGPAIASTPIDVFDSADGLVAVITDVTLNEDAISDWLHAGPSISDDGSTAIYSITRDDGESGRRVGHVYSVLLPDGEPVEIGATIPDPQIDVSGDGTRVLLRTIGMNNSNIFVVGEGEQKKIVEEVGDTDLIDAVIAGDGSRVYFSLRRDTQLAGVDGTAQGGIWAINSDGSGLEPVLLLDDARGHVGAAPTDVMYVDDALTLDTSHDGDRLVGTIRNVTTGERFVIGIIEGSEFSSILHGPADFVNRAAISGDGSTVLVVARPIAESTLPSEYHIISFDGGSTSTLQAAPDIVGTVFDKGVTLNHDGSFAFLGKSGHVFRVSDGAVVSLLPNCLGFAQTGPELTDATISASFDRVVYLAPFSGGNRLALIELMPDDVTGVSTAERVSVVPVEHAVSSRDPVEIMVEIRATADTESCATVRRDGVRIAQSVDLNDDGRVRDSSANDGTYTGALYLDAAPGPVTVRIAVETQAADGRRTTWINDLNGLLTIVP